MMMLSRHSLRFINLLSLVVQLLLNMFVLQLHNFFLLLQRRMPKFAICAIASTFFRAGINFRWGEFLNVAVAIIVFVIVAFGDSKIGNHKTDFPSQVRIGGGGFFAAFFHEMLDRCIVSASIVFIKFLNRGQESGLLY